MESFKNKTLDNVTIVMLIFKNFENFILSSSSISNNGTNNGGNNNF